MKTLFLLGALMLVFFIGRHLWRQRGTSVPKLKSQTMVRCQHCGLFLPKDEAIQRSPGRFFCPEHKEYDHS